MTLRNCDTTATIRNATRAEWDAYRIALRAGPGHIVVDDARCYVDGLPDEVVAAIDAAGLEAGDAAHQGYATYAADRRARGEFVPDEAAYCAACVSDARAAAHDKLVPA